MMNDYTLLLSHKHSEFEEVKSILLCPEIDAPHTKLATPYLGSGVEYLASPTPTITIIMSWHLSE